MAILGLLAKFNMRYALFMKRSNFGTEAVRSYLIFFLLFEPKNVLEMFLTSLTWYSISIILTWPGNLSMCIVCSV